MCSLEYYHKHPNQLSDDELRTIPELIALKTMEREEFDRINKRK